MLARCRNCANARATGSAASTGIDGQLSRERHRSPFARAALRVRLAQRADALDALGRAPPLPGGERLAEQLAEQPHVVAERLVRVFSEHRCDSRAPVAGSRARVAPRARFAPCQDTALPFRHRHRRRAPDRLAAAERASSTRSSSAAARSRCCTSTSGRTNDDFSQLTLKVSAPGRAGAGRAGRRPDPARLPRRGRTGRARARRRPRRLRPGGLLLDHQPAHAGAPRRTLARRSSGSAWTPRSSSPTEPRRVPEAARIQRRRPRRVRARRHPRHAGVPRPRPRGFRLHDQRRVVGAARRGQRHADRAR